MSIGGRLAILFKRRDEPERKYVLRTWGWPVQIPPQRAPHLVVGGNEEYLACNV